MKKVELEKKLEESQTKIRAIERANTDANKILEEIKLKLSNTEINLTNNTEALKKIISVLAGKASHKAKGAVIEDLLRVPVEEEKMRLEQMLKWKLDAIKHGR